jgi:hypothetical protein
MRVCELVNTDQTTCDRWASVMLSHLFSVPLLPNDVPQLM